MNEWTQLAIFSIAPVGALVIALALFYMQRRRVWPFQ
jgi:hypothetical protein